MERPDPRTSDPAALDEWARLELERAAVSDDDTKLAVLDGLHETLEAGLDEDPTTRP
jgi:hypothetical protein